MANSKAGEVALEVDGKAFLLKPNSNAMAIAEEYIGRPVFDVEHVGVREARGIIFALTKGQHGIRTIDDVGALLDADLVAAVSAAVEAIRLFFQMTGKASKVSA